MPFLHPLTSYFLSSHFERNGRVSFYQVMSSGSSISLKTLTWILSLVVALISGPGNIPLMVIICIYVWNTKIQMAINNFSSGLFPMGVWRKIISLYRLGCRNWLDCVVDLGVPFQKNISTRGYPNKSWWTIITTPRHCMHSLFFPVIFLFLSRPFTFRSLVVQIAIAFQVGFDEEIY